ncbi:hypothetical protein AVEN_57762-1, partial [Araneus ventricosus]
TKDGEELKMGDKYVMLQEDDETFTMAIKDVSQDDSGKYCAEAINDMGKDDITYDVRVTTNIHICTLDSISRCTFCNMAGVTEAQASVMRRRRSCNVGGYVHTAAV